LFKAYLEAVGDSDEVHIVMFTTTAAQLTTWLLDCRNQHATA
jgi:hypothetical protein